CRTLHGGVRELLDATIFFVALYDQPSQTVEVVWQIDSGIELGGGSFPLGSGFTSQVIRTGQPMLIRSWTRDGPPIQLRYASDTARHPESALIVPLRLGSRVMGVISAQTYRTEAYTQRHLDI